MAKSITELIGIGFKSWWKNKAMILPFLFSSIIASIVMLLSLFLVFITLNISISDLMQLMINPDSTSLGTQMTQQMLSALSSPVTIILVSLIILIMLVVVSIITAYFNSGAIGMANNYFKLNKIQTLKDMHDSGKKFMWRYFSFQFLSGLAFLIFLLIFFVPFILTSESTLFLILFAIAILIVVITSFFISLTPYIIITQNCSVWLAFKKSFKTVAKNFWAYIGLGILWGLIGALISILSFIPVIGQVIISLATPLLVEPASAFSYTRFVIERCQ